MTRNSKNILVTGGNGYIGINLVKNLIKKYENIYILGRSLNKELNSLIKQNKIKFIKCDLIDMNSLSKFKAILKKINVVLHLAAYVPKTSGGDDLDIAIRTNLIGTINLIKNLKKGSKFVFVSTCEVYGIPKKSIINEDHSLNPHSYYGASKVAAENFLRVYTKKNGAVLTILRLTNVYGPGEVINRAIPNFIRAIIKNESPVIYGDGSDKRDFIYFDDAVNYIIAAIEKGNNNIYNIAAGKSYPLKEIAEKIIKLSRSKVNIKFKKRRKIKADYTFDISKVKKDLKYTPKISIEEGLLKEIEWFKKQNEK